MKLPRLLSLVALVFGFTLSLQAQVSDTYVIPAVANASGANGTRWATQISVFNPQSYDLKVSATFIPTGGTVGREVLLTISPNVTASAQNVLDEWFGRSGTGSLAIATFPEDNPTVPNNVIDRSFIVTSNTFNNSLSGTFGQAIPGTRVSLALLDFKTDGISGIVAGVTNSSSGVNGYRTNIGAVNTGRTSVTLFVTVRDKRGTVLASKLPFGIPPQGHLQDRLPVLVDAGSLEFMVDDPSGKGAVYAYASVIDNRSGDPLYLAPTLLASPNTFPRKMDDSRVDSSNVHDLARSAVRVREMQFTASQVQ